MGSQFDQVLTPQVVDVCTGGDGGDVATVLGSAKVVRKVAGVNVAGEAKNLAESAERTDI